MFTILFSACTLINKMFLFYRMSKKNCKYSQEDLTRALNAIKNGTPCATASKRYSNSSNSLFVLNIQNSIYTCPKTKEKLII
jgi:hypothetical protein